MHPGVAALVLATAALTWYAANLRWRFAEITYVCSLVLAGAIFFTFRPFDADGSFSEHLLLSLLTHATVCLLAGISLRFNSIAWLNDYFRIPLQFASLAATGLAATTLVVEQWQPLPWSISCIACCWLAALWLTLAVLEVWPALFGAFQVALGAAWIFGSAGWLTGHDGWDCAEPYSLHIYGVGLAALCLAWEFARSAARSHPRCGVAGAGVRSGRSDHCRGVDRRPIRPLAGSGFL